MANVSDVTRKGQVLKYLQQHAGKWVDGPELANERVGGSEGLKRLRELRSDGHRIVVRAHPDPGRDIFQYKLVPPESIAPVIQERLEELVAQTYDVPREMLAREAATTTPSESEQSPEPPPMVTPGMVGREMPMRRNPETGEYELAFEVCVDCGGPYKGSDVEHQQTDGRHLRWIAAERQKEVEQQRIALDPQPPAYRYTKMPDKIVVGESFPCPRCQGYRRPRKLNKKTGEWMEAENFSRDPYKGTIKGEPNPCMRSGGFGIVPARGDEA